MRILVDGRNIKKSCRKCGSVLELSQEDIKDCEVSIGTHFDCPICRNKQPVPAKDVPSEWLKEPH